MIIRGVYSSIFSSSTIGKIEILGELDSWDDDDGQALNRSAKGLNRFRCHRITQLHENRRRKMQ